MTVLTSAFAGELIGPRYAGDDQARKLYNGMHNNRPALIARCTGPHDVQAALAYARAQHMIVSVRGRAFDAGLLQLRRRAGDRHRPDEAC